MKKKILLSVGVLVTTGLGAWYLGTKAPKISASENSAEVDHPLAHTTSLPNKDEEPESSQVPGTSATVEMEPVQFLEKVLKGLPHKRTLQKHSPEEVHAAPPEVWEASQSLGEVAQLLKERPDLTTIGIQFYARCAKNSELLNSVRALCLHDYWKLNPEESDENLEVPQEILELEKHLAP